MKLMPTIRWPFRFGLRALFVAVAIVAGAIGLWIRPHTVEVFRPDDGTLYARYRVQRNWRGEQLAHGAQEWFLPDGACFRRQEVFGARLLDGELWPLGPDVRSNSPVYPPHRPPNPPTADYVRWLRQDELPVSTDLPAADGELFSYP